MRSTERLKRAEHSAEQPSSGQQLCTSPCSRASAGQWWCQQGEPSGTGRGREPSGRGWGCRQRGAGCAQVRRWRCSAWAGSRLWDGAEPSTGQSGLRWSSACSTDADAGRSCGTERWFYVCWTRLAAASCCALQLWVFGCKHCWAAQGWLCVCGNEAVLQARPRVPGSLTTAGSTWGNDVCVLKPWFDMELQRRLVAVWKHLSFFLCKPGLCWEQLLCAGPCFAAGWRQCWLCPRAMQVGSEGQTVGYVYASSLVI